MEKIEKINEMGPAPRTKSMVNVTINLLIDLTAELGARIDALEVRMDAVATKLTSHIDYADKMPCNDCGVLTDKKSGVQWKNEPIIPLCQNCVSLRFGSEPGTGKIPSPNDAGNAEEFISYLEQCTDEQVLAVYEKEYKAGRSDFANLAEQEIKNRKKGIS